MGASDLRGKRKLLSQFLEQKKNITSQAAYTNARIQSGQNHQLIIVYYSTLPFFPGVSKCRENCGLREEPLLYPRKISTAKTRPVLLLALPEAQQHDKDPGERRRRGPKDTASSAQGSALPLLPPRHGRRQRQRWPRYGALQLLCQPQAAAGRPGARREAQPPHLPAACGAPPAAHLVRKIWVAVLNLQDSNLTIRDWATVTTSQKRKVSSGIFLACNKC